jgi:hypothetical protein
MEVLENIYAQYGILGLFIACCIFVIYKLYTENKTSNETLLNSMKEQSEIYKEAMSQCSENLKQIVADVSNKIDDIADLVRGEDK